MVRLHQAAVSVAAVSIAGAGIFAAAAPAGAATGGSPHVAHSSKGLEQSCGGGASKGNEWACIKVLLNPSSIQVSDRIIHSTRTVQICVRRNGMRDKCTSFEVIKPGQTESAQYDFQGPGRYCARVWRLNPDGSHSEIDSGQCVVAA